MNFRKPTLKVLPGGKSKLAAKTAPKMPARPAPKPIKVVNHAPLVKAMQIAAKKAATTPKKKSASVMETIRKTVQGPAKTITPRPSVNTSLVAKGALPAMLSPIAEVLQKFHATVAGQPQLTGTTSGGNALVAAITPSASAPAASSAPASSSTPFNPPPSSGGGGGGSPTGGATAYDDEQEYDSDEDAVYDDEPAPQAQGPHDPDLEFDDEGEADEDEGYTGEQYESDVFQGDEGTDEPSESFAFAQSSPHANPDELFDEELMNDDWNDKIDGGNAQSDAFDPDDFDFDVPAWGVDDDRLGVTDEAATGAVDSDYDDTDGPSNGYRYKRDALDCLTCDLGDLALDLGVINIQMIQRQLQQVGDLTMDQARSVVTKAFDAITQADTASGAAAMPGEAAKRSKIKGDLQAHSDAIGTGSATYDGSADLRDVAIKAFIAYNAAAESDSRLAAARGMFFSDVWQNIQDLPKNIGGVIGSVASNLTGGLVGGLFKGLFENPVGAALILGGAYFAFRKGGPGRKLLTGIL